MFTTLSFGEVLWDVFPDYKKPGGSPANLAYHLHCLGNKSVLLSQIGDDTDGEDLVDFLKSKGQKTDHIQKDKNLPTGRVTVKIDEHNEPSYTIHQPSAWDNITTENVSPELIRSLDAICFASLSQRKQVSADSLNYLLSSASTDCLKVFDVNLRPPFIDRELILNLIKQSDVIKVNEDEFWKIGEWLQTQNAAEEILKNDPSKIIILTLGASGSAMYTSEGYYEQPAFPISGEGDFVGVGDAFLACFTHLVLNGEKHDRILKLSNRYAAYVASEKGGMPDIPSNILEKMRSEDSE